MTYRSTQPTKYLTRFLDSPISEHSQGDPPAKPAKPPFEPTRGGSGPSNFKESLPTTPGKTGETPAVPIPCARWGPSADHDEPSIDVPAGHWLWRVANLPTAEWVRWRRRSAEIGAEFARATGQPLDAEEIAEADRMAAEEMGAL